MLNVFDIQRGSYHDGPGIRTVVFLKGCPLCCKWCQNPESQANIRELMYYEEKCILCQKCVFVCPQDCYSVQESHLIYDRSRCIDCGECAKGCNTEALKISGEEWCEETLAEHLLGDKEFFDISGGGVTLSGGEPLLQYKSCSTLLKLLKQNNIHTAIETCGYASDKAIGEVLPYLDCVLYDVKIANPKKHQGYCGQNNELIFKNLQRISDTDISLHVRIPVIPAINDDDESINDLGEILKSVKGISTVTLIPYHSLGKNKYRALGREYECEDIHPLPAQRIRTLAEILHGMGLPMEQM